MSRRQLGFSLVELMIAILLASITAIVVLTVLSNYQSRSTNLVGRNDAQISAAVGLYALEKEVRMAGSGLNLPAGQLCPQGVNISYDDDTYSDGAALMPLRIIDGGAGPDSIELIRSDSAFGAAPTRLVSAMGSQTDDLSVDSLAGFRVGDLLMIGGAPVPPNPAGTKVCTLMGVTGVAVNGSGWLLSHDSGDDGADLYNPADPAAAYSTALSYDVRDVVVNLGQYGVRRYSIVCTDGAAPSAGNNCDLAWFNPLFEDAPDLASVDSIAPQIVGLQAQYGVAAAVPVGSQIVDEWVDATDDTGTDWANPSLANQARIKAVRISIIARANRDSTEVAPVELTLWDGRTRALSADEQRFRYQVLTVVVPLINTIWAGV